LSHDVQQFDEQFKIGGAAGDPANTGFLTVVNQYGGSPQDVAGPGPSGWDAEESADVEWAHAIAPGANILLVEAANQDMADEDAAVQYAASPTSASFP
jgi:subtilase family serine protease